VEIVGSLVVVVFQKENHANLLSIESLEMVGMAIISKAWRSTKDDMDIAMVSPKGIIKL
jgi:hypothetical protein